MNLITTSLILANSFSIDDIKRVIGIGGALVTGIGLIYAAILIITTIRQRGGGSGGTLDGLVDGLVMAGAMVLIGGAAAALGLGDLFVGPSW